MNFAPSVLAMLCEQTEVCVWDQERQTKQEKEQGERKNRAREGEKYIDSSRRQEKLKTAFHQENIAGVCITVPFLSKQ